MDTDNPVVQLCIQATQAEYAKKIDEAASLYWQAWREATDAFEKCVAAHYVARIQKDPQEMFRWNFIALTQANRVGDQRVQSYYPSLYLNMGKSCELIGNLHEAQRYYTLANELGFPHQKE